MFWQFIFDVVIVYFLDDKGQEFMNFIVVFDFGYLFGFVNDFEKRKEYW